LEHAAFLVLLGVFAGILIGMVGIGGVVVAPALIHVSGMAPQHALSIAMGGFVATGVFGLVSFARNSYGVRRADAVLLGGALIGAVFGSLIVAAVSPVAAKLFIAIVSLWAGVTSLRSSRALSEAAESAFGSAVAAIVGLFVGVGSAASGTGGPLLLLPVLLWKGVNARYAIALAQAIQLPIALAATATNSILGVPAVPEALYLGFGLLIGMQVGMRLLPLVPISVLRRGLAVSIMGVAVVMAIQAIHQALQTT
jgi:uncharacterized membrane protein YfcA